MSTVCAIQIPNFFGNASIAILVSRRYSGETKARHPDRALRHAVARLRLQAVALPTLHARMDPSLKPSPPSRPSSTTSSIVLVSHTVPTSSSAHLAEADAEGVEWTRFVEEYAKGRWDAAKAPAPPAAIRRLAAERTELHLCERQAENGRALSARSAYMGVLADSASPASSIASSGEGSSSSTGESPADLLDFYRRNGHMPAPKGEFEEERLRTVKRYGIDQPRRRAAVEAICAIAKSYFKTSTVIVSL